jgi:predicted Zn-dependent protease
LQNHPQDARFLKLRADSHAGLGHRSQYHLALAELTALKGQTAGAIEQLQLAQQAGDANFYEMSMIDGRLREMRKRQIEEMKERRN